MKTINISLWLVAISSILILICLFEIQHVYQQALINDRSIPMDIIFLSRMCLVFCFFQILIMSFSIKKLSSVRKILKDNYGG